MEAIRETNPGEKKVGRRRTTCAQVLQKAELSVGTHFIAVTRNSLFEGVNS
jgi:hypothetical protein